MDLQSYLAPIRKWWWLVISTAGVGLVASAVILNHLPPTYQARAALMIGRTVFEPNPTTTQLGLGERLADTYAALARRDPVRNATKAALGLAELPRYETRSIPEAQLVEIIVTDTSPQRAQAVANEIANQVILLSPTGPVASQEGRQRFIDQQLDFLQANIEEVQARIAAQQEGLVGLTGAVEIARAQAELEALQTKLAALQANYATLLASSESGAVNFLTLIEPAGLPERPIGPSDILLALLAGVAGGILGCSTTYLLEYMDTSLKTPEEALRLLGLPVIGMIGEIKPSDSGSEKQGGMLADPTSQPALMEALRVLRTNLEFASVDRPLQAILMASPGPDEGKTTIAVHLASAMAHAGKSVAVVDADLRQPGVHKLLGIPMSPGLSDIFLSRKEPAEIVTIASDGLLLAIPAGKPPPNPTELLSSRRMDEILVGARSLAEILVVDAPPFSLADASVLASKVDGVLVIVRPGHTSRNAARAMLAQLDRAGATVLGMVLNRVSRADLDTLGDYKGYLGGAGGANPAATALDAAQKR